MRKSGVHRVAKKFELKGRMAKDGGCQKKLVCRKWLSKVGKSAIVTLRCVVRYFELFEYLLCSGEAKKIMGFGGGNDVVCKERGTELEKGK